MVGSNKMRNRLPNKVRICSEDALDDSYVCSGYIFPQGNRAVSFAHITSLWGINLQAKRVKRFTEMA